VLEGDLSEEGASYVLDYIGIDLNKKGLYVVEVIGKAEHEELPECEIVNLIYTQFEC
jgi:hypothetical protein